MKGYFVTGTDTNVGKSLTAAALTLMLSGTYWKPVESGDSDYEKVKEWTGLPEPHFIPPTYSLKAPLSPDQAARRENICIDLSCCQKPVTSNPLIIEGAGGIFAPLNEKEFVLDLIKKFQLPAIIVSRGTLGTINHTLMTIEVLRQHKTAIHGIVFNGELHHENQLAIEQKGKVRTLFHLPHFEELNSKTLRAWHQDNAACVQGFLS